MPLARDKILINGGDIDGNDAIIIGNAYAIQSAYEGAERIAEEIQENDWLAEPEALAFLHRQEALCATFETKQASYHLAQRDHLKQMRELVNDMRLWLDGKLLAP